MVVKFLHILYYVFIHIFNIYARNTEKILLLIVNVIYALA